jgi:sulfoxide reductase heme-binding subunit YedZ
MDPAAAPRSATSRGTGAAPHPHAGRPLAARLRTPKPAAIRAVKAIAFVLALLPLARLVAGFFLDRLGANPIELITRSTGTWTLSFLLITLSVTPLRRLTGWHWLLRLRRMFGLFAFFYACLHFTTYIWLDQFFDLNDIAKDVVKRPFITVGFTAFVLLIPLAATSTNAMVKRLGAKRWQWLHRAVYAIAVLGVTHFLWLVKKDIREPLVFIAILACLLGFRLLLRWRESPGSGALASQRPRPRPG